MAVLNKITPLDDSKVYNLVVRCDIDGETKDFMFDYVEDTSTTVSSDITTHPLVNGDVIADHMYNNPIDMSFSGTFSLFGNKKYNFGTSDRLANIQETFERINREGIMCTLVKRSKGGDENRFKVRKNMVLTSINWTEHQSSMDFSFQFKEAITAIVDEPEYDKDIQDKSLPRISDPLSLDVTDELLNVGDIIQVAIATLSEEGLFADNFLENAIQHDLAVGQKILSTAAGAAAGAAVGLVGGLAGAGVTLAIAKGIACLCGVFAAIPGPGWVAAAIVAAVAVVAGIIVGIIRGFKKNKYQIKRFKYYKNNSKKQQKEIDRFNEFIGKLVEQFEQLEQSMSLYGFGEDDSQQCFVTINSNYYIFSFTKSTEESQYALNVIESSQLSSTNPNPVIVSDISEKSIQSLSECSSDTLLFSTSEGTQVYLANTKTLAKRESGGTNEEIEALQKNLTNYAILASNIDLTKFKEIITEIVKINVFK